MDRLQDISRLLLAAGGTPSRDGKTTYFTYAKDDSIRMRTWTGSELIDDELIADEVRTGTSAPIVNRSHKKVFVVGKDGSIKCFTDPLRDDDQVEDDEIDNDAPWNEETITGVDTPVHPQSQLAVSYDKNTVFVFYQKPDGTLGCINEHDDKWKDIKLPAVAALDGTPLATCNTHTAVFLFYIGANKTVRYLENCEGKWKDVLFSAAEIVDPDAKLPGPALKLTIAEDRQAFERIRPLVFCLENNILSVIKFRSGLETVGSIEGTEFVPFVNYRERNRYYFWSPYPYYVINKRNDKDQAQHTTSRHLWDHLVRHSLPEYQQESGNMSARKHSNRLQEPLITNRRASTVNIKTSPTVSVKTTSVQAIISPQPSEQRGIPSGIPAQNSVFAGLVRFTDPFNLMGRIFGNRHNEDATQETASRDWESDHIANFPPQENGSEMNGREDGTIEPNRMDTSIFEAEEVGPREAGFQELENDQDEMDGAEAQEASVGKDEQEPDSEGTEEDGSEGTLYEDAETAPSELEEGDFEEDQSEKIQPEEAQTEELKTGERETEERETEHLQTKDFQAKEHQPEERQPEEFQPEELQPEERQPEERQPEKLQPEERQLEERQLEERQLEERQLEELQPNIIQTTNAQNKDLQTKVQKEETHTKKAPTEEAQAKEVQAKDAQARDAQTKDVRFENARIETYSDDIRDKEARNEEIPMEEPQAQEAPTENVQIKDFSSEAEPEELENLRLETIDFGTKKPASKSVEWAGAKAKDTAETSPARSPAVTTRNAEPSTAGRSTVTPRAENAVAGGSGNRSDTEESDSESFDSEDSDDETSTHGKGKDVDVPGSRFTTQKAIRADMDDFVNMSNLSPFFPDDSYLDNVARNAANYRNKKKNRTKGDAHMQSVTRLNIYQPVLYCDDSTSMRDGKRVRSQKNMVRRVTRLSTCVVPSGYGTSLQFINLNSEDVHNDKLSYNDVKKKINSMHPRGNTKIGTNLNKKILKPLVYDVISSGNRLERPIFISCITDGCPSGESTDKFKKEILKCVRFLDDNDYPRSTVRFQISQIGNDPRADRFLQELRGEILRDPELKEVLYCTAERLDEKFEELKKNEKRLEKWLLQTLLTPLMGERINTLNFDN